MTGMPDVSPKYERDKAIYLCSWFSRIHDTYYLASLKDASGARTLQVSYNQYDPELGQSLERLGSSLYTQLTTHEMSPTSGDTSTPRDSWMSTKVRASLIVLLAAARGLISTRSFSQPLQDNVRALRTALPKNLLQSGAAKSESRSTCACHKDKVANSVVTLPTSAPIPQVFLPGEVEIGFWSSSSSRSKDYFVIRWRPDHPASAPDASSKKSGPDVVLHASGARTPQIPLLTSTTAFTVLTCKVEVNEYKTAFGHCSADNWRIGALILSNVLYLPSEKKARNEMTNAAMNLAQYHKAAEEALGVSIGVMWDNGSVAPAVMLRGKLDTLLEFAKWIPAFKIGVVSYTPPPGLAGSALKENFAQGGRSKKNCVKFSSTLLWTQDQFRKLLAYNIDELRKSLSLSSESTLKYVAHAAADCILIFLHITEGLPVRPKSTSTWLVHSKEGNGVKVSQHLILPESLKVRVAGISTLEIEVDESNSLLLKECEIKKRSGNNRDEIEIIQHGEAQHVRECTIFPGDPFFKCGNRMFITVDSATGGASSQ